MSAHTPRKLPIAAVLARGIVRDAAPRGSQPAKDTPAEAAAPPAATTPAPARSRRGALGQAARRNPASEPRLYQPGTGIFVNTAPMKTPPPPGPQEASLNFESLDVREVAKVILGDYLHASYTVHPAVTGTVTFRTVRPIADDGPAAHAGDVAPPEQRGGRARGRYLQGPADHGGARFGVAAVGRRESPACRRASRSSWCRSSTWARRRW